MALFSLWRYPLIPSPPFSRRKVRSGDVSGVCTSYPNLSILKNTGLVKYRPGGQSVVLSGSAVTEPLGRPSEPAPSSLVRASVHSRELTSCDV